MSSAYRMHRDTETCLTYQGNCKRRSANYKRNIWNYDRIQSLSNEYNEEEHARETEDLRKKVVLLIAKTVDPLAKLELIDSIEKLGLAYIFGKEIKEAIHTTVSLSTNYINHRSIRDDLYASALCFRLLRQHGHTVSQDVFLKFMEQKGKLMKGTHFNVKAVLELYEASHLALVDENILHEAKLLSTEILRTSIIKVSLDDEKLIKKVKIALKLPLQWSVEWYNVKRHIQILGKEDNTNNSLLKLAKLNFNMVQATQQKDLKQISRWWRDLGLAESLSFTRNRMVESYLWTVGVSFEPCNASFRKWLAKIIKLIVVIDDIYDIYGSLEELKHFTEAVNRWDVDEIEELPGYMKICFQSLHDTTKKIAMEIQEEKGWSSVEPYLQKAWGNFCKALLVEAEWYNMGNTPSLDEYLNNGWISSSGPLLSLLTFFSVITNEVQQQEQQFMYLLQKCQNLIHYTSLIIRLCNDEGTSTAELKRGDAPSSILCFMKEANVSEEGARSHIKSIISNTWMEINIESMDNQSPLLKPFLKCTVNTARVAHFIYQNGDGFGIQDHETRDLVLSLLVEPLALH